MINDTATRVAQHSPPNVNLRILQHTQTRVDRYRGQSSAAITDRLWQLDQEWDVEAALQTTFACASSVSLLMTNKVHRHWAIMAFAVPLFMVQHAVQGWCPPLAVFRRLGFRTDQEINEERFALKALRGDFDDLEDTRSVDALLAAVRR